MLRSKIVKMIILQDGKHVMLVSDRHGNANDQLMADVKEWLITQADDRWDLYTVHEGTHEILDEVEEGMWPFTRSALAFGNADEAFAFKMRWC